MDAFLTYGNALIETFLTFESFFWYEFEFLDTTWVVADIFVGGALCVVVIRKLVKFFAGI